MDPLVSAVFLVLYRSILCEPFNPGLNEISLKLSTLNESSTDSISIEHSVNHRLVNCGVYLNNHLEFNQIFNETTSLRVKPNYLVKCQANVGLLTDVESNVKFKFELLAMAKDREPPEDEHPCPETSNHNFFVNHIFTGNVSRNDNNQFSHSLLQYDRFGHLSHYCIRITPFIPGKSCSKCASYSSYQRFTIVNDPLKLPAKPVNCENISVRDNIREETTLANMASNSSGSVTFQFGTFQNFEMCKYPSLNFFTSVSLDGEKLTYSIKLRIVELIKMNVMLKTGPAENSTLNDCLDTNSNIVAFKIIEIWHESDNYSDEKISVLKPKNFGTYFMGKNFKLDKFITIPKNLIVPPSTVLPVTNENRNFWLIIILIVISAFFVLGVALMIFKRILNDRMFISNILSNPANVIIDKGTNLRAPLQANSIPIDVLPRKREVTIVYTREVPKILETNIALVNFLRVACNLVEIRFDLDDEVAVRENPLGWYTREDQQFIYIETEGAVLRENNFLNNRKTYHIEEDALDDAFLYSFNHTIDNPSSRTNSSKYIVVHFTFTPEDVRFDTYANCKRYIISSNRTDEFCHLAQLCHFINYNEDLTPSTANLKQFYDKWKDTTKFKALRCAIHEATCYVKENPNYVREIFRVTSESFSENEVHEGFRGCSKSSSESENDKLLC